VSTSGRESTRNWPMAVASVLSLALVLVVLPNPLRIPQSNPSAQAEYAPVPGRESDVNSNFSQANVAESAGIGSGGDGEGGQGTPPPPPPAQYKPRQKNCVGNPPRQTEDPLSPPCVPFWDGDNKGATWQGVTKNEIKIVYYNDFNVKGDLTKPYKPSDETGLQGDYYYTNHVRTAKALLRYFTKRYQTYGRTVKMIAVNSEGGLATPGPQRVADAYTINAEHQPFAVANLIENAQTFVPPLAEKQVPAFGWNEDVPRRVYERNAPYFWSFMPDQETEMEWVASFFCRKLRGQTAKFTDDENLKGKLRTFGLMYPKGNTQRGPFLEQMAKLLIREVKRQCGMTFDEVRTFTENGKSEAPIIMADWKRKNITTAVCYCVPQINELTVPAMQNAATSLDYFPEWYFDHATAMDRGHWQQEYGSDAHKSFGVSNLWRQPAFKESYAYQAYLSEEPGTMPNLRFNFEMYHVFLNLFSAIQAAGPILTPESAQRGMYTFWYQNPTNPYVPTGGYGPSGPSPYTFVHTAMAWWWDPTGTPPGGLDKEGCIRVVRQGVRFLAGEWPIGDADLRNPADPCTADTRKRVEH